MQKWAPRQKGFTIVELLIVIVVIGILAAITIVAYNGIQGRAKDATVQSTLTNTRKQLESYRTTSASDSYPTANDCSASPAANTICLKPSGGVTFAYSTFGQTKYYCASAIYGDTSYIVTNSTAQQPGTCTTVTNLEPNPSSEAAPISGAGAGVSTRTQATNVKVSGTYSTKLVWTSGSTGVQSTTITVSPSTTYALSLYVYSESGAVPTFNVAASDYSTNVQQMTPITTTGDWQRISRIYTTSAAQTTLRLWTTVGAASTFYVDGIMITQRDALTAYADGSSNFWSWTGAANNSTSSGPPL